MKAAIISAFCILFFISDSDAQQTYNILKEFSAPTVEVGDLTYDGTNLWLANRSNRVADGGGQIYKISPSTGSRLETIRTSLKSIGGLAYVGNHLWAVLGETGDGRIIYKIDPTTKLVVDSFQYKPSPHTATHGMAYHDGNFYLNLFSSGLTVIDTTGDTTGSVIHNYPSINTHAIIYDGCQWLATANGLPLPNYARLLWLNSNWDTLNSIPVPGGSSSSQFSNFPNGLAWDGSHIWIANNQSNRIYQIEIVTNFDETVCNSLVSPSGNFNWTSSGIYYDTLSNFNGCDSILKYDLTVNQLSNTISRIADTLTAHDSLATYQWLNCETMTAINGAINQHYVVDTSGQYAVAVSNNGCIDTSECIQVYVTGINENNLNYKVRIYPNPASDRLFINLGEVYNSASISINDLTGRLIQSKECMNCQRLELELEGAAGFYFVTIESKNNKAVFPFLKE